MFASTFERRRLLGISHLLLPACLALALLSAVQRAFFWAILPYFDGSSTATFREDNFWSYSSGFLRRGFPGEAIYRLDLWTQHGPLIFSLLITVTYFLAWYVVAREAGRYLTPVQSMLALLSPLALHAGIDGEIFLLLPLLYLVWRGRDANELVALLLIGLALAIRESAILFYLPLIAGLMLRGDWTRRLVGLVILTVFALSIIAGGEPTYLLEHEYWPAQGVEDLRARHLYLFAELPLGTLLDLHQGLIRENLVLIAPSLLLFGIIYVSLILQRTGSLLLTGYFIAALVVFFTLTIDYGRYFYLPFAIALLMTSPGVAPRLWDPTRPHRAPDDNPRAPVNAPVWLTPVMLGFVLAPSGYYAEAYTMIPRIAITLSELWGAVASRLPF